MKKVTQNRRIVNVRRSHHNAVNQFGFTIHANVCLPAEIPLISFPRLMHLRIALFFLVFGGAWRTDNAGIDNGSPGNLDTVLMQIFIHQREKVITRVILLHEVAKLTDSGFVRSGLVAEVDTDEVAHGTRIVDSFFGCGFREIKPMLKAVDTQHALDANRPTPCTFGLWVKGLNGTDQTFPGDEIVHFREKLLFTSFLAMFFKAICQGLLSHEVLSRCSSQLVPFSKILRINQSYLRHLARIKPRWM